MNRFWWWWFNLLSCFSDIYFKESLRLRNKSFLKSTQPFKYNPLIYTWAYTEGGGGAGAGLQVVSYPPWNSKKFIFGGLFRVFRLLCVFESFFGISPPLWKTQKLFAPLRKIPGDPKDVQKVFFVCFLCFF